MDLFIGTKFDEHDSAVYIINLEKKDIFAMSTERITRYKHDYLYPVEVIKKYIERNKIEPSEVANVYIGLPFNSNAISTVSSHLNEKELLFRKVFGVRYIKDVLAAKKEFKYKNALLKYPQTLFKPGGIEFLKNKLIKNIKLIKQTTIKEEAQHYIQALFPKAKVSVECFDHPTCHAYSSFFSSPFETATLLTLDGYGDGVFSKAFKADRDGIAEYAASKYEGDVNVHVGTGGSIGEIYTYFTELLGFQPLSDEGKVEALAAYGNYDNELYHKLMELVTLNEATHTLVLDAQKAIALLKRNVLQPYLDTMSKEDISAAVQKFLENSFVPYVEYIIQQTGYQNVCISGGVAANVIMNLNVFENVTPHIHIVPAMGDEGSSEGACLLMMLKQGHTLDELVWIKEKTMPYFGSSYTQSEILPVLDNHSHLVRYENLGDNWHATVAELLYNKQIGALFQGRMEWGPRALGNRSIIAITNDPDIRTKINKEIKKRPLFQPFCPSILIDEKERLFEKAYNNRHMTCAFRLKKEFYEDLPSAIHVDGTARVQFVSPEDNPSYYKLIHAIKERSGFGVVINTSFNKHGRTIVESPKDAIDDFLDTDLDFLLIEGFLVKRKSH